MKNIETKVLIEVEGVILTQELLDSLKAFQNSNNEHLNIMKEAVAEVICWISYIIPDLHEEYKIQAIDHLTTLSTVHKDYKAFKKP